MLGAFRKTSGKSCHRGQRIVKGPLYRMPPGARASPARARPGGGPQSGRTGSAPKTRPPSAAPAKKGALGTFGPYTKLKAVGKGSFGQIWLVRHTQKGGEQLVLKAVNLKKLSVGETASQKRETEVLKKMSHPHIISFSLTFEEGDMVGLMMEYAAGGDLSTAIAKRVPPLCKEGTVRYHESEARRRARTWPRTVCPAAWCHHSTGDPLMARVAPSAAAR